MRIIACVILCIMLSACVEENPLRDLRIRGIVVDENKKPISFAQVTILCWRKTSYGEETYSKIDTIADSEGNFTAFFKEGFTVHIGAVANGFFPRAIVLSKEMAPTKINLMLLKRRDSFRTEQLGYLPLLIREDQTGKKTDFIGINLDRGVNTSQEEMIDIMLDKDLKSIVAKNGAGIAPILKSENNLIAPSSDYHTRVTLSGKEQGFFVRNKDSSLYGRLIIFGTVASTIPDGNGGKKEKGFMFNVSIQKNSREFGAGDSFRLDYYILENIRNGSLKYQLQ